MWVISCLVRTGMFILFYKYWKQPTDLSIGFIFWVAQPAFSMILLCRAPFARLCEWRSQRSETYRL